MRNAGPLAARIETTRRSSMNKDQIKGTAKEITGKVQQEAGKLVGSEKQQAKGIAKQVAGKAQKVVGDVKQALDDSSRK